MDRRRLALLALFGLVVLSGCTLPHSPDQFDTDREPGYVAGYAHDDAFAFDDSETLTESQLEDVKYRSMARIEAIRGLKFHHDVELEVITRAEYRSERGEPTPASPFVDELWRGAFVVDGETDVNRAMADLQGANVQGYYVNDQIVVIVEDADEIRLNREVLVHELVHALQDQHFGLERRGETIDERRAELGLLEGEANYVPHRYDERCDREWQCVVDHDPATTISAADDPNLGLLLSTYAPYSEGPAFVADLYERADGWDAVDAAYDEYPASTSQLIHPERYPDDRPIDVGVTDRSSDEWEPITRDGDVRTETIGEATIFASLWSDGVVERPLTEGATDLSPYNYSHPATEGWAGDTMVVYERAAGDGDETETGHVWRLAWESEADAATFADAYRDLLESHGGESVVETQMQAQPQPQNGSEGVYRIPDGDPFAGAYRVVVDGDTVEIVGAPAVDDLEEIRTPESAPTASVGQSSPVASAASAPADG
ncbi:Hvo_1808 family surface protein [Natronolimnohabitans innermongolicus]|uniref:Lipoprotein n=1 Tax=Natronolimnohabitans innermongolicus JCM 12255 TaxID=1227499 RepID=L9X4U6_9EURY|nr:Hvo_1808 family surface protein [Natronolimnohabitans innermongolicus]ELY56637.1 hypothetical protein C493_09695 [Natronolimnohabitans innermongolicus JCM 12255]